MNLKGVFLLSSIKAPQDTLHQFALCCCIAPSHPCQRSLLLPCALKIVEYFVTMIVNVSGAGLEQTCHGRWMAVIDRTGRDPFFTACWFDVRGVLNSLTFLSCRVSLFFPLWSLKDRFLKYSVQQLYNPFKQYETETVVLDILYSKVSKSHVSNCYCSPILQSLFCMLSLPLTAKMMNDYFNSRLKMRE